MAWQEVVFRCGCDGHIQVYGPTKDRQRKADWIADKKDCDDCYADRIEKERAEAVVIAKAQAAEWDLPELEGSEKQVAWAERIRATVIKAFEKSNAEMSGMKRLPMMEEGQTMILSRVNATFWIDEMRTYNEMNVANVQRLCESTVKKAQPEVRMVGPTVVKPEGREPISSVAIQHKPGEVWLTTARKEDESFIEELKDIGFRWDGTWAPSVPVTPVGLDAIAAGIARGILDMGYTVIIPQPTVAELVVSGRAACL